MVEATTEGKFGRQEKVEADGDPVAFAEYLIESFDEGKTVSYTAADIGTNGSLTSYAEGYEITDEEYRGEYVVIGRTDAPGDRAAVFDGDSFAFIG